MCVCMCVCWLGQYAVWVAPEARLRYGRRMLSTVDALLQEFLPAVRSDGELSFVFARGALVHVLRKSVGAADFRTQSQYGGRTEATAASPEVPPQRRLCGCCEAALPNPPPSRAAIQSRDVRDERGECALRPGVRALCAARLHCRCHLRVTACVLSVRMISVCCGVVWCGVALRARSGGTCC